jgi:hypothetical protein
LEIPKLKRRDSGLENHGKLMVAPSVRIPSRRAVPAQSGNNRKMGISHLFPNLKSAPLFNNFLAASFPSFKYVREVAATNGPNGATNPTT